MLVPSVHDVYTQSGVLTPWSLGLYKPEAAAPTTDWMSRHLAIPRRPQLRVPEPIMRAYSNTLNAPAIQLKAYEDQGDELLTLARDADVPVIPQGEWEICFQEQTNVRDYDKRFVYPICGVLSHVLKHFKGWKNSFNDLTIPESFTMTITVIPEMTKGGLIITEDSHEVAERIKAARKKSADNDGDVEMGDVDPNLPIDKERKSRADFVFGTMDKGALVHHPTITEEILGRPLTKSEKRDAAAAAARALDTQFESFQAFLIAEMKKRGIIDGQSLVEV